MNPLLTHTKQTKQQVLIVDKLHMLVNTLQHANSGLKHIAERCGNRKTQAVVFGLATESLQTFKELSSKMQVIEGKPDINPNASQNDYNTDFNLDDTAEKQDNTDNILDECTSIEQNMILAYRKLLNDSIITGDLRKLLQEQLNSFLYAFVKLKMLRNYKNKTIDYNLSF